jgi:protein O-mannosyl-transferase
MSRAQTPAKTRAQRRKDKDKDKDKNRNKEPHSKAAGAGSFLAGRNLNIVLCFVLAAATIALYSPAIGNPFVHWDDDVYVTANSHIQRGLAWDTIRYAFTSSEVGHWHPLTWFSHALDCQLFALNPAGHHFDSVLIHTLNVVLLFLLLTWATKRTGPSLLVAALFAVHPLNVESVAWVAERKNVLSTLFFLLSLAAYGWYARRPDWRRYLLVAVLFAAGLMGKPMVITLPFVLLLLDYWPLHRVSGTAPAATSAPQVAFSRLMLEKIPLLLISVLSAVVTLMAQRHGQAVGGLHKFPLGQRIEAAIVSYGLYLWKMFWPARLAALYPHPANWLPLWQATLCALILAAVTALAVIFRRKGYLLVGWLWFLGTLIPVIGLVQVVGEGYVADRYTYVPAIGIFVMTVWGLDDLAAARNAGTLWRVLPAMCALTALGFVTHRQIGYWDSDYDLWSHALAVTEMNPFAQNSLADALTNPDRAMATDNPEIFGSAQTRADEARGHRQEALRIQRDLAQQNPDVYLPDVAMTLQNLGNLDRSQNRFDEARQHFEEALEIYRQQAQHNPDSYLVSAAILNQLGIIDGIQNRRGDQRLHYEEALRSYRQLAQQNSSPATYLPSLSVTVGNLGNLDLLDNRPDEARLHYDEALKIQSQLSQQDPFTYLPEMFRTLNSLGNLDLNHHQLDEAHQHYAEALNIHRQLEAGYPGKPLPSVAMTLANLGNVSRFQNRIGESRAYYQEALTILQKQAQSDSRYAGDVARVEAILKELDKNVRTR